MKSFLIAISALIMLAVASCQKDSGSTTPATDSSPSLIQIDFPVTGAIYANGSALNITGTITDNDNLSTAKVEVKNKTTNATLNQQTSSTGNVTFYRFQWSWTITGITATTPGTVKITAKDKNGFEVTKEVDITLDN